MSQFPVTTKQPLVKYQTLLQIHFIRAICQNHRCLNAVTRNPRILKWSRTFAVSCCKLTQSCYFKKYYPFIDINLYNEIKKRVNSILWLQKINSSKIKGQGISATKGNYNISRIIASLYTGSRGRESNWGQRGYSTHLHIWLTESKY